MKTLISILLLMSASAPAGSKPMYQYIITETGKPTSFDPLDADQTLNLPVARMVYTTPLEITPENSLGSLVLESFKYNPKEHLIEWTVKSGLKFNDGSSLTTEDIAFAVARMAYTRPKFPVIEHIAGLDSWLKEKTPLKSLPSGIKVQGNKIEIKLTQAHAHPLFRFCLELFSIIPKKCVNLESNKVACEKIPGSGYYILEQTNENSLVFNRSGQKSSYFSGPEKIEFKYIPALQLIQKLSEVKDTAIIAGNEGNFSLADLKTLQDKMKIQNMPAARFQVLQINPAVGAFKNKLCRQVFAQKFRQSFAKVSSGVVRTESSIFVSIVPGYLSDKDLAVKSTSKLTPATIKTCIEELKSADLRWAHTMDDKNSAFVEALKLTLKDLGINKSPQELKTRKELADLFVSGKAAFFNSGSGFWPLDPAGDLQMLFTPNLHKPLEQITKDEGLQQLIRKVQVNESDINAYKEVNQHLYDEAMFNVYGHVRRFFASKDANLLTEFPAAITSPSPWQVFRGK